MRGLLAVTVFSALVAGGCTCLDLGGFQPYACDFDAGIAQCPGDGVCGLEGVCHARGDQQPWECREDSHCEGSWRCGPQGQCLDPAQEELLPSGSGALTSVRLGQLVPDGLPSHVAGFNQEVSLTLPTCAGNPVAGEYRTGSYPARLMSLALDGGLYTVLKWTFPRPALPDGGFPTQTDCEAYEGRPLPGRAMDVLWVPLPPVRDLAATGHQTLALLDGGVVCRYGPGPLLAQDPAGECSQMFSDQSPPAKLRLSELSIANPPLLLGLGKDHLQVHNLETGVTGPVQQVRYDGGVLPLHDAVTYGHLNPLVLAATPAGVYGRRLDGLLIADGGAPKGEGWEPIRGGFGCAEEQASLVGASPTEPLRFQFGPGGRVLNLRYREEPVTGGFREGVLIFEPYDLSGVPPTPGSECVFAPPVFNPVGVNGGFISTQGCRPCPDNSEVRWVWNHFDTAASLRRVEARCSNPDGGFDLAAVDPTGNCSPFKDSDLGSGLGEPLHGARYTRPVTVDTATVTGFSVADDLGHQWQPTNSWALEPWSLDRSPSVLFNGVELTAVRAKETHGRIGRVPVPVLEERLFAEGPLGYLHRPLPENVAAGVQGRPRWLLVYEQEEGGTPITGLVELLDPGQRPGFPRRALARLTDPEQFGPPYLSTTATTSDDRTVWLLASGDTLLAADLTQQLSSLSPEAYSEADFFSSPEPAVKFTAVMHAPVQSLTTLAPGATPRFVEGYLVQAYRVFHFTAANINVWRTEEVLLEDNTEPLAVFADGVRARVGMKNGTVYSLPSQLVLAPALPAASLPVTQYLQHCGQLFAVAADGVRRLSVGTGPTGDWEAVTIPGDYRYSDARLFAHGEELRLFTSEGVAVRLSGVQCRAPAQ